MDIEITTISPSVARAMLDKNAGNRRLSAQRVAAFARDMEEGRWVLTGDQIKFDKTGRLLDGQHRLHACVQAAKAFKTTVIYKLPEDAMQVLDSGKSRTPADALAIDGHHNTNRLSAAAKFLFDLKHGQLLTRRIVPTTQEILGLIEKHKHLPASSRLAGDVVIFSQSQVAALHYIGAYLLGRKDDADLFMEVCRTGVPAYQDDPVHKLREKLLRERGTEKSMRRTERIRTLISAFDMWMHDETGRIKRSDDIVIRGLDLNKI